MWVRGQVTIEEQNSGFKIIFEALPFRDYSLGNNVIALDDIRVLDGGICAPKRKTKNSMMRTEHRLTTPRGRGGSAWRDGGLSSPCRPHKEDPPPYIPPPSRTFLQTDPLHTDPLQAEPPLSKGRLPPVDRQTPVKTLPFHIHRMRSVIIPSRSIMKFVLPFIHFVTRSILNDNTNEINKNSDINNATLVLILAAMEGYYYRIVGGPTPFEGRVEVDLLMNHLGI